MIQCKPKVIRVSSMYRDLHKIYVRLATNTALWQGNIMLTKCQNNVSGLVVMPSVCCMVLQ